jgi:hypothetical protein
MNYILWNRLNRRENPRTRNYTLSCVSKFSAYFSHEIVEQEDAHENKSETNILKVSQFKFTCSWRLQMPSKMKRKYNIFILDQVINIVRVFPKSLLWY